MDIIRFAPQNSIVFIEDSAGGEPPEHVGDDLIHYNAFCVSVGCYPEIDGETEFTLGAVTEVKPDFPLAFDGVIATPTNKLIVSTVLDEHLLEAIVPTTDTRIRIWLSHARWPDKVVIGWG